MRNRKGDETAIFSKGYEKFIPSAIYTARVLEQAPVIVFVINTKGNDYRKSYPSDQYMMDSLTSSPSAQRSRTCASKRRRMTSAVSGPAMSSSLTMS